MNAQCLWDVSLIMINVNKDSINVMLMRTKKAEAAVHGRLTIFMVDLRRNARYQHDLSARTDLVAST